MTRTLTHSRSHSFSSLSCNGHGNGHGGAPLRLGVGLGLALGLAACGDVGPTGSLTGALTHDPTKTVTIQVHGWNLSGSTKDSNFGDDRGGGDIVDGIRRFGGMPHSSTDPNAPNQITATEYYGNKYPAYYTDADKTEVDALKGIPRYALIVAKYAKMVMARSGADGINLTCHSMGCEISRYLIENDVGKLASDGKIKRWVSFAGVVNGAKLADIDSGKWLTNLAKLIGLDLIDVEHMNRTWVEQYVSVYDHKRVEGNNPLFGGIIVHHICATNPKIDTALGIPLMDLLGSGNVANDGIVLTEDMYLQAQQSAARFPVPSGNRLAASKSNHFAQHFDISEKVGAQAIAAANIVGGRRVKVTLSSMTLLNDKESIFWDKPPAEVVVESSIRYPYVSAIDTSNPLIDETSMERRNSPVFSMNKGETKSPGTVIFEGPVFDAQTSITVNVNLKETDFYPAGNVNENWLSAPQALGSFSQTLPLSNGDYTVTTPDARFTVSVAVEALY